ncbi:response regulator [Larkinella sp. VNQ87]|uniref:response regulator n=1 Tax=Larkinella sp. VNQ87 TaxID=3400921 RepID=UPI003C0A595A
MEKQINILIVEDEAILAMALSDRLEAAGYCVVGMANNGTKAIDLFRKNEVDLLLCDIAIKGEFDGIETVRRITESKRVPVIYLTAFSDDETIARAKSTYPAAFMTKPYNPTDLRIAIDMAIHNFARNPSEPPKTGPDLPDDEPDITRDTILQIDEQVFVKQSYHYIKVNLGDIMFLAAEDIYTTFITSGKKYALRLPLSTVLEKLDYKRFVRIHRSYAVNVGQVHTFSEQEVTVGTHIIPLSKTYRNDFLRCFQLK